MTEEEYSERVDLKVYDVPVEIKNKYISLAKLEYDNQLWKVLEEGMDKMLEERSTETEELQRQVTELKKEIGYLKTRIEDIEHEEKTTSEGPSTFGNKAEDEILDKFEK